MRTVLLSLAAAAALATPALANEARVEARTGILIDNGTSWGTAGVAAGYDFDLGGVFAGVEVSGDKVIESNTRVSFGAIGRLGLNATENDKIYALGGYASKICASCEDAVAAGLGLQHSFGKFYVKGEYRHLFANNNAADTDLVLTGLGYKF